MTETVQPAAPAATPLHTGSYVLFRTPTGGLHVTFKRTHDWDAELAAWQANVEPPDTHLPDIPAEALPLIESWLENGFPPAVLAMLGGKVSPLKMMGMLKGALGNGDGS
jgi:hypothetical protein